MVDRKKKGTESTMTNVFSTDSTLFGRKGEKIVFYVLKRRKKLRIYHSYVQNVPSIAINRNYFESI